MLQANPTSSAFASTGAPPAPYGRPRRGTPDYANAVRRQIARLAALHAASVAEAPPAPPVPVKTVLLVAACPRVRQTVRASLRETTWIRLLEATSVEEGRALLATESHHLVLIDQPQSALLRSSTWVRAVLIADVIPRSDELPRELAGVLARPLKAERVADQVLSLLAQPC
jgi:hypothetical protein